MGRASGLASASVVALACAVTLACYDSTWGQAKRAQRRAAADSAPAAIHGYDDGGAGSPAASRTLRVRVHTTERFLSQTIDAPKQIASLLDDANSVLIPTFKVRLAVDRVQPWSRDADDDMEAALAALRREDAGEDADLVVGMIGSLPRQTDSFHEMGIAPLLGKHLLVRAASRLGERDTIDQTFSELGEEERARILAQRKRHRAEAVFLHEFGHTLGAIHENDVRSLMHAVYDPKMSGFGGGAVALMRIALDESDARAVARAQLDVLRGAAGADWVTGEREQEISRLEGFVAGGGGGDGGASASANANANASASAGGGAGAKAGGDGVPPELAGDDADRFRAALSWFHHSRVAAAYDVAKPLFAKFPDLLGVQDLRCQLATLRFLDKDALKSECAPYVRLSAAAADAGARD